VFLLGGGSMGFSPARRAYTLIEMLIVITVVAIVTAFALPKVNYLGFRIDAGARGIRTALQRAQAAAVAGQHNMIVSVDLGRQRLVVVEDNNNNLLIDAGERVTVMPLQTGVVFGAPSGTWAGAPTPTGAITGSQLQTINGVFRGDGAASSDAQIYLTSTRGTTTDQRGIGVTQATGHVDQYRNTGSVWTRMGS